VLADCYAGEAEESDKWELERVQTCDGASVISEYWKEC
jgi:hypothetical protein